MADVIFTQGSVPKNQLYTAMVNAFIAAGWTNISSNAATDFDVLQSPGETGDKNLVIQMRPTSTTGTNSTLTTNYNVCSYRLIDSYIPGTSGVAGTFGRAAEVWQAFYLIPATTQFAGTTVMSYYINVNKNRMIISIETPLAVGLGPVTHYIGLPDVTFCSEPASRGVLFASSAYGKTATSVHITNAAGELASEAASSDRTIYCQLAPKNPNSAGLYAVSEMKYGSATEGYRGKLNGIFALPATSVNNGDIITIGNKRYRVSLNQAASTNAFPTTALAYQIS